MRRLLTRGERAAGWIDAAARRCAQRASRGGAGSGQGGSEHEHADEGEGGEGKGCWVHKWCFVSLAGVAARLVTVMVLTRVSNPCNFCGQEMLQLTFAPEAGQKIVEKLKL